jgi:PAS domain S-box-containing protein
VLIVEDDGNVATTIRELLLSLEYEVIAIAATSVEALAQVTEKCPDVVLMDIRIQGELDGIATAEILKQRFDVPIVYLTAHADEATVERAKKTEPFGFLMKPINPPELRSAIEIAHYKHGLERHLRKRERWLSTTMRSIADAVIMVDIGGRITFMNPAAEILLGVALADTLGQSARDIMRVRDPETARDTPLERALRERRPIQVPETLLECDGGPDKVIADSAAPVIDEDEMLGAVMVFRDVTEAKRLQKQLEISDRLASLGTMAAGVAHEINNPLAVVVGNGEFVLEHLSRPTPAPASGALALEAHELSTQEAISAQRELVSAASRIARIVADLRDFARPTPEPSASVDVRDAIEWALRSTAHEFRHRARLSTKLEKVPLIEGDETRLGQIFVNLLINAAQAIAPGNVEGNEVVVATRTDEGGGVVVDVSDTGGGVPPEVLSRMFDPFFTTKAYGVGTGLGLSICKGIVASMGGEISVDSRVGEGTSFHLKFPASVKQELVPSAHPPRATVARRGRLLLIDDEDMVLKAICRILDEHEIVATADAREALARLEVDDRFDVILCDLMMPTMTGMDFYEELLRLRPDQAKRVVFLTGGALTAKVASFLDTVPNQRLQKPFGAASLRTTIQQLLANSPRTG